MGRPSLADGINPEVPPDGSLCVDCEADGGWWVHLRRCAQCGHIGCCDDSPAQHATAHYAATGHPAMQSFEPGEDWFWSYPLTLRFHGPTLAEPHSRPDDQPSPGPAGRVPDNWRDLIGRR
ncbi:MAG: UBP-type zinc finger domain-containing protein [Mycetocola sp.]